MSFTPDQEIIDRVAAEHNERNESDMEMAGLALALGQISTNIAGWRSNILTREVSPSYSREQLQRMATVTSLPEYRPEEARIAPEVFIDPDGQYHQAKEVA